MWVRALHLGWHLTVTPPDSYPLKNRNADFDFVAMVPLQAKNSVNEFFPVTEDTQLNSSEKNILPGLTNLKCLSQYLSFRVTKE